MAVVAEVAINLSVDGATPFLGTQLFVGARNNEKIDNLKVTLMIQWVNIGRVSAEEMHVRIAFGLPGMEMGKGDEKKRKMTMTDDGLTQKFD